MTESIWKFKDWVPQYMINQLNLVHCYALSKNTNSIWFLYNNPILIDWDSLSYNMNAIDLLSKNIDKIYWNLLSSNPSANDLLSQNIDKIDPLSIFKNLNIFEIDYTAIKSRINIYSEELLMRALHPSRIQKMIDSGCDIDDL